MLLNPDPKRRAVQLIRVAVALSIMSVVLIGLISNGSASITISDDWDCYADGMYVRYDGTATVNNTFNSDLRDAEISIGLCDQRTGERVPIWSGTVDVPARSSVDVPLSIKVSSFSLSAAIIDSLNSENSPIKLHVDVRGRCMYGLMNVNMSFDCGVDLAKEGTHIVYDVIQNDDDKYHLSVGNLSEKMGIPDDVITIMSGTDALVVKVQNEADGLHLIVTANGPLDAVLASVTGSVTGVHTSSGTDIDAETARDIAAAIDYARWLL